MIRGKRSSEGRTDGRCGRPTARNGDRTLAGAWYGARAAASAAPTVDEASECEAHGCWKGSPAEEHDIAGSVADLTRVLRSYLRMLTKRMGVEYMYTQTAMDDRS